MIASFRLQMYSNEQVKAMQHLNKKHRNKKYFSIGMAIFLLLAFCPRGHTADIELEWSNVTDDNLAVYTIYYRPDYCCDYRLPDGSLSSDVETLEIPVNIAPLSEGTVWDDLVPNLDDNRSYYFVVTASNDEGEESGFSNEVRRKAPQITNPPVVTHVDSSTAVIEWLTDTPGTTVLFYRKAGSPESKWNPAPTVYRTRHSAFLDNLSQGTTYFYRAGSANESGYDWDLETDDDNPSKEYSFKTTSDRDKTPPVLLYQPVVGSVTDSSATIQWKTDEPSSTKVRYDTVTGDWGTYALKNENSETITDHTVTLTGLTGNTDYYFRVGSADTSANQTISSEFTFKTARTIDATPPIFTVPPVVTTVTSNLAIIEWTTDDHSSTKVRYGLESAAWPTYPSKNEDFTRRTTHRVVLTGLQEDTFYFFRAASANADGFQSISTELTFKTNQIPDTQAPVFTAPPTVEAKTNNTAIITWETDEPSNSSIQYEDSSNAWGSYDFFNNDGDLVTKHVVTLTNLKAGTKYYYRTASMDAAGNGPAISRELSFVTDTNDIEDNTAPQITSLPTVTAKTNHTLTVEWTTDVPSNSMLRYCADTEDEDIEHQCLDTRSWENYSGSIFDRSAKTDHRVIISGLEGETTYYFRVASIDVLGRGPDSADDDNNPSVEIMAQTNPDPDAEAPQFTSPPAVTAKSDTAAIIEWYTDEPSTSMVQFGTASASWDGYVLTKTDPIMVTHHHVALTNLTPNTNYFFRVGAVDEHGNGPVVSMEITFKTDDEDNDNAPVVVLPPTVTGISNNSAVIEWTTDEPGNSVVQYAISDPVTDRNPTLEWDSDLVVVASEGSMVTDHSVTLTNLTPEKRYKFRVGSTDADGNGPSLAEEEKNNPFVTDTFKTIGIIDTAAPTILTDPIVSVDENNVSQDDQSVIIEWETDEPSSSIVKFGVQQNLQEMIGGTSWQNLPWTKSAAEMTTLHRVTLTNLNPSTTYTFRLGSADAAGNGPDLNQGPNNPSSLGTFTTADIPDNVAPKLTNVKVLVVTDTTALITWETDEPSNSIVRYASGLNPAPTWQGLTEVEMESEMTRQHSVTLTGLVPSASVAQPSYYTFMVGSVDATGNGPELNQTETNPASQLESPYFSTEVNPDDDAPQIINETVNVTATGDTFAVIEWDTDEPGNSLVQYSNPRSGSTGYAGSNSWGYYPLGENDAEMVTHHIVALTGLAPNSLYYFRVSSTDASGNNHAADVSDDNPSIEFAFKTEVADPPSIIVAGNEEFPEAYPKIDYANNTIDITFDEQNIKNAGKEGNYIFTAPSHLQPLEFLNPGESIVEINTVNGTSTYRFYMTAIPPETIITMMLTEKVTDTDGNPVTPLAVVLNDNDSDELPDDWEIAWGLDPFSSGNSIGQGKNGDFDNDGLSNYLEFLNGTDPKDYASSLSDPPVPEIIKRLPVDVIDPGKWSNVPNDTAIAVLITAGNRGPGDLSYGIDLNQTDSVRFVITISQEDEEVETIDADLATDDFIRVVKLYPEESDSQVSALWVAYHHFDKNLLGAEAYPFGALIDVTVRVSNSNDQLTETDYSFTIETEEQYDDRIQSGDQANRILSPENPSLEDPVYTYDAGIEATANFILGTKLVYDAEHPVLPQFGVTVGAANIENVVTVDKGTVIQSPTVFSPPAKLVVPIDSSSNPSDVDLYIQDGENWVRACDSVCNPGDGGFGWIVPGSRVNTYSSMEVKVYHSASFQSGIVAKVSPVSAPTTDEQAEATCLIDSLLSH
jgi:hypothetical protein